MQLTQQQIGQHLDMSQKSVSQFLAKEGLDCRTSTLDEIRVTYLRRLRASGNDGQLELTHERILTERVDREMKQHLLDQKKLQLINLDQLEAVMMVMVETFKSDLLAQDAKLKADLDARYGVDIDIELLNSHVFGAMKHFGRFDLRSRETA